MPVTNIDNPLHEVLSIHGNEQLLQGDLTLILNSRQSKTPVGSDSWIEQTIAAVKNAISSGETIITSIHMNTWEFVLWAVGEFGGRAVLICPDDSTESIENLISSITDDFNLIPEHNAWLFIDAPENSRSKKTWWEKRDDLAFRLASKLIPVSVRSDGRLDNYINSVNTDNINIVHSFNVEYQKQPRGKEKINLPETVASFENWNYLTHWTRRCYGPWPGEKSADFYSAIAASGSEYPRSAFYTLKRILTENRLRGSGDHIRNNTPVAAFTTLKPPEALPLMRWRKRYVRPTFEPYGIAINYRSAVKIGIGPVTYVKSGEKYGSALPEFMQGYGTGDWPNEKEWRAVGDVDLSELPEDAVVVIVPSEKEAEKLMPVANFEIRVLETRLD